MATVLTSETLVLRALRRRFSAPEYAMFSHVRNTVGYTRNQRTADAIIMGMWPSRGLHLHAVEVKVTRSDWLREKRDPNKQEAIAKYCNYMWLALGDAKILKVGELPRPWGLLVPRGKTMMIAKQAPLREAEELDRGFVASILREAQRSKTNPEAEKAIRDELRAEYEGHLKVGLDAQNALATVESERDSLQEKLAQVLRFEQMSGVRFSRWTFRDLEYAATIIKALRRTGGNLDGSFALERLRRIHHDTAMLAHSVNETIEALEAVPGHPSETSGPRPSEPVKDPHG